MIFLRMVLKEINREGERSRWGGKGESQAKISITESCPFSFSLTLSHWLTFPLSLCLLRFERQVKNTKSQKGPRVSEATSPRCHWSFQGVCNILWRTICGLICVCVCVYLYVCLMAGNVMTVCEYVPYSTTHSSCQRVGLTKAQLSSISPQADKNRNLQLMWIFKLSQRTQPQLAGKQSGFSF